MSNFDDVLSRKAYIEAGRALALYAVCFNLTKWDKEISSDFKVRSSIESPIEDISTLLRYCRDFAGLSLYGERTEHWNDVAYAWRASHLIFLGGCAAERIKWKITETPSLSDPEFEKSYYAQQWFWVDLDHNPSDEQVLGETIDGLDTVTKQLESHWKAVDILATTLFDKSQLSAEETFQIITANIDTNQLAAERKARHARPPEKGKFAVAEPVAPKPRVEVNYEVIQDWDLIKSHFLQCCDGNGDSFPFKCSVCGHIMVFCYECDTLYPDLNNTTIMQLHIGHFSCPQCNHEFEDDFMRNLNYYVTPTEWKQAGYESHLTETAKKKLPSQ